jgi:F-type H+-transporting ATPase subunit b
MAQNVKAGTAVPSQGLGPKIFPPLDTSTFASQLVWLALTFGFLYFVLSKYLLPRIGEVIEERATRIKRDLAEAERLQGETKSALADYEKALNDARAKSTALGKETQAHLAGEADKERAAADALNTKSLADAEKRIAETKLKALANVNTIAGDTAAAIVAKLTGMTATPDEIKGALAAITKR